MTDTAGTYILLAVRSGGSYMVDRVHEGAVETAYEAWHTEQRNTVLHLTHWNGDDLTIVASEIQEYSLSSEAGRAKDLANQVEETERNRSAFKREWD